MDVRIAPATPAQYHQIGELSAAAYRTDGQFTGNASQYESQLRDVEARSRQGQVMAATDPEGAVIGAVVICPTGSKLREVALDHELEFRMLAVAPQAQGHGVGEALVRCCLDYARDNGYRAVVLCTRADRAAAARRLYQRLGFARQPQRDWEPEPGIALIAMTLAI